MPELPPPSCQSCRYWAENPEDPLLGECRRYAPRPVPAYSKAQLDEIENLPPIPDAFGWQWTLKGDACGDYAPRSHAATEDEKYVCPHCGYRALVEKEGQDARCTACGFVISADYLYSNPQLPKEPPEGKEFGQRGATCTTV